MAGSSGAGGIGQLRKQVELARHGGVLPGTVLEVDWAVPPAETMASPLAALGNGLQKPQSLREVVHTIRRAAEDDRISGLIARVQAPAAPLAVLQELREAVVAFRAAGKRAVAWSEGFPGNGSYYLATAFDRVLLQPAGGVVFAGLLAATPFLGETLPFAGIEPDFGRRYEYKNAVDTFTATDYTPAHREATERLLDSTLEQLVAGVAEGRALDEATVRRLVDEGPFEAEDALARGLVDRLCFRDEAYDEATGGTAPLLFLHRYAKRVKQRGVRHAPKVAVVSVHGAIAPGRSGFKPGIPPGPGTGSDTVTAALRDAVADSRVKAIVLRVDSPGGAVGASEAVWREVVRAKQAGKPVVASMGSVAASGGYYVAMAADRIVANPATVTGSIGVFSGKFVTAGLRDKVRLATGVVKRGENADMMSALAPFTPAQRAKLDEGLDKVYDVFTSRVAEGRGMAQEAVHEVAKGRVWTGADALERGLVDRLGGFEVALDQAKELAGLAGQKVAIAPFPKPSPLERLKPKDSSEPAAARVAAWAAWALLRGLDELERRAAAAGAQAVGPTGPIVG